MNGDRRSRRAGAGAGRLELRGVFPSVPLALGSDQEIDEGALRREVRVLVEAGASGLLVNGVTGEGNLLAADEPRRVCALVVAAAAGRLPVVAAVLASSTRQAVELGQMARAAGASALLVPPGSYLNLPSRAELAGFYRAIAGEVGLPLVLFNAPGATMPADLCRELAEIPEVVAVKQGDGDFRALAELLHAVGGQLAVLSAVEDLLFPSLVLGADGVMAGIATLLPRVCGDLIRAVRTGDLARGRQLHERLLPVVRLLLADESYPANLKAALALMGRPVGPPRSPLVPPSSMMREKILRTLQEAGFLPSPGRFAAMERACSTLP